MENKQGSLKACHGRRRSRDGGRGPRGHGQKGESEEGSVLCPPCPGRGQSGSTSRTCHDGTPCRVPSAVGVRGGARDRGQGEQRQSRWSASPQAGLALGLRWAPVLRAVRALDGQASSSSEKAIRNRASADPVNPRAPEQYLLSVGSFLCEGASLPGARLPRTAFFPVPSEEPQSATCQRTSEQGTAWSTGGRSDDLRRSLDPARPVRGGGRSGGARRWLAGLGAAWPVPGLQAGLAAVATSSVTRRWTRCSAGPPAGSLRSRPWAPGRGRCPGPPWAGSPAGSRGCPG